jgi:hypothetical protein
MERGGMGVREREEVTFVVGYVVGGLDWCLAVCL